MYAVIEKGLDPTGIKDHEDDLDALDQEILVVGACIQVLLTGLVLTTVRAGPHYRMSAEEVAKKLKDIRAEGMVKDPHAAQVLEVSESSAPRTYLN